MIQPIPDPAIFDPRELPNTRHIAAPARSELEAMRRLEEVKQEVVAV